jgi:PKD repeat protein
VSAAPACHRSSGPPADAGADVEGNDGPVPISLAVAITGCRSYALDGGIGDCVGDAPLTVALAPVSSPDFVRFTWSFGDGTPDVQDRAPKHTYALPGTYAVLLTGVLAPSGTVQATAEIEVQPLAVGLPCDVDAQCAAGLRCSCAPGSGCAPAFTRGLCTVSCDGAPCPTGGVCASVPLAAVSGDGGIATRAPACLAGCDPACPAGFACASLVGPGTGGWVRGCLPVGALGDVGAPCRNANGDLDPALCATGYCADLGALGVCAALCDSGQTCPTGSACATLTSGTQLCLAACSTSGACQADPLLACTAAGGFQVDASAGLTFCAPKACSSDADCAPAGRCGPNGGCVAR